MSKPHKHAELIKAWADGAIIQCYDEFHGVWKDRGGPGGNVQPRWIESLDYRIKPKIVEYVVMDFFKS